MYKSFSLVLAIAAFLLAGMLLPSITIASSPTPPEGTMCYDLYQPVCGAHQVECFAAPCYPVYQTYSNSCFMATAHATLVHEDECTSAETGFIKPAPATTTPVIIATTSPAAATSSEQLPTPSFLSRCWHWLTRWFH